LLVVVVVELELDQVVETLLLEQVAVAVDTAQV
jgi:hypothetical protein